VKKNYTKDEITELISNLSSDNQEISDFAMGALLIANPHRHLSDLFEALQTGDEAVKAKICYILGGNSEKRCVAPLLSMLNEKSIIVRIAAIDSLQYFPDKNVIQKIIEQLKIDNENLHHAAITALGEFLKQNLLEALPPLIDIIRNENNDLKTRHLAMSKLKFLDETELNKTLKILKDITDASLYAQVLLFQDELKEGGEQKIKKINKLIENLLSEQDFLRQFKIEDKLVELGGQTARILIEKIFEDVENLELRMRARIIFERLGLKIIPAFKTLLETFDQYEDFKQVFLFQDLITIVSDRQFASLESSLLKVISNINEYLVGKNPEIQNGFLFIKSDIHFALAKYGSNKALEDMRNMFSDGTKRHYIDLIKAIGLIGEKDFLLPLINQYHVYKDFKELKSAIKKAFKAIAFRERINKNNPIFDNLSDVQAQNLKLILR